MKKDINRMKRINYLRYSITIAVWLIFNTLVMAQLDTCVMNVQINNIPSNDGQVIVSLHEAGNLFPMYSVIDSGIGEISNQSSIVSFKVIRRKYYALSVHHDENGNGKMDMSIQGKPIEQIAISNDASSFTGFPKYEEAKFKIKYNPTLFEISF